MSAAQPADLTWTRQVRRRRAKVPTVLQMEATECGAACLAMVAAHYGAYLPLEDLRIACGVSRDGANARSIMIAGRSLGLEVDGYRLRLEDLPNEHFPLIAFWRLDHFVVLEGVDRRGVWLNDPAIGPTRATWLEVDRDFSGVLLRLKPGTAFSRRGRAPSAWQGLRRRLAGFAPALLYLTLACLALALPVALAPMALQGYVDQVLVAGLTEWLPTTLATLLVAAVLTLWLTWWQQVVARRLGLALSQRQAVQFIRHALRLPVSYFLQRYVGDVAFRVSLVDDVSQVASVRLIPALVGLVTAAAVGITLVLYSWVLALVAAVAGLAIMAVVRLSAAWRTSAAARAAREDAGFSGALAFGLRSIETVKATGTEDELFVHTSGRYARTANAHTRVAMSSLALGVLPTLAVSLVGALFVAIGGVLVIDDTLTPGGFVAVLALMPLFLGPVATWAGLATTMQQTRASLDRIDDLLDHPPDQAWRAAPDPTRRGEPLSRPNDRFDVLAAREVSFGFSRTQESLLQDISLELRTGRSVGVVGPSGCGKSTLARLLVGLLTPWTGEVTCDGVPLLDLDRRVRGRHIGYVDQDVVLFPGTVRDNITLFDPLVPDEVVVAAARAAGIHDEIAARRGGYDAEVTEGGSNFSGGQRQRLEIARTLAARPRFLVLDEATSALDPVTEEHVVQALRATGAGLLLVAHRLATVRECDEIVVLDAGRVVERGTHDELAAAAGLYAAMVHL